MGRVAAGLLLALVLAGCGERTEPVEQAEVQYPVTVQGSTYEEAQAVRPAPRSSMARVLEELGAEPAGNGGLLVAWASDQAAPTGRAYLGADATIDDVERSIVELGLIVGRPERARELVSEIETARARGRRAAEGKKPVRVFVDLGFYATAGDRTLIGDIVREAGGVNVAGATPEPGPFPVRQLREADPQVYVISSDSRTTADDLRENPRTRTISAVRDGRIVVVPAAQLQPGPEAGEGVLSLARALHGDAAN